MNWSEKTPIILFTLQRNIKRSAAHLSYLFRHLFPSRFALCLGVRPLDICWLRLKRAAYHLNEVFNHLNFQACKRVHGFEIMRSFIYVRRDCTYQWFFFLAFLYVCKTGVQIFWFCFTYFIFASGCVFLAIPGLVFLARGWPKQGWAIAIWNCALHVLPSSSISFVQLLSASLHHSRNGSPVRGKESSVGGKNVSKPECWERQDVSNCGLIAGFLYYSSEAQPTHSKCTLG